MPSFPYVKWKHSPWQGLPGSSSYRFLLFESITDRLDEEIPADLLKATDSSGQYQFLKAAGLLLPQPTADSDGGKTCYALRAEPRRPWQAFDSLTRAL